eukprot:1204244-Rhodomonas_salina.5
MSMCTINADDSSIAKLLSDRDSCQKKLQGLLDCIEEQLSKSQTAASFSCIPQDMHSSCSDTIQTTHIRSSSRRGVDNQLWDVESPSMLGIFHGYVRMPNGERKMSMFMVCDGGCTNACIEYYNMMLDLGEEATLYEAAQCEETWWLQRACSRCRNRILYMACQALSLDPQQSTSDIYSMDQRRVVVPSCETLRHDFFATHNNKVCILNSSVDTTRVQNGIMCRMHPSEGIWVFKGAPRANSYSTFGGMFGNNQSGGVFPTETFETQRKEHPTILCAGKRYLHFNNQFMQNLSSIGWDRDYGVIELIPIAVVYSHTGNT